MHYTHIIRTLILWFNVGGVYASSSKSQSPCGKVSQLVASQLPKASGGSEAEATPTVPAKIAHDCLNTLPLNTTAALEYLDLAEPYIQWQTNLDYVKSPPAKVSMTSSSGIATNVTYEML